MFWKSAPGRLPIVARSAGREELAGRARRGAPPVRRPWIAVVTVAILLLGAVPAVRAFAAAQEASPAGAHPAVGTWRWENDRLHPGDPSFAVIQADGTYIEYYPGHGVGIGAWEATGDRSISLTIVFQDIDPSPDAVKPGLLTYRLAVVAEDGGNALSATGPYYVQELDGSVVEELAFDGTAARIEVAETGPLPVGTPAATP